MAYTFDQLFAVDPANPANVARNASVTIFAPGDVAQAPLTLTTLDGQPLTNPITVNANGYGSAFMHATLDRVAWAGGGFTGFITSYEGMKAEAVAARTAADTAAANAATSATNAATSASLVGAPADTAVELLVTNTASATRGALNATYATAAARLDEYVGVHRGVLAQANPSLLDNLRTQLGSAATAPVTIVAAGDSVTNNANATAGNSWVELLNKRLAAAFQTRPYAVHPVTRLEDATAAFATPGIHVVNGGISGSRSENYLSSGTVPKAAVLAPALIIHTVGFNDWGNAVATATYKQNVKNRIDQLKAAQVGSCVHLLVHSFEYPGHVPNGIEWYEYGVKLKEISGEYSGVMFVDISGPLYAAGVTTGDPLNLVDTDNVHPTNLGHDLLARLIYETITLPARSAGTTGVTTYAADTFTRADSATLGSTEIGAKAWTTGSASFGTYDISAGTLRLDKTTTNGNAYAVVTTGFSDGVVSVKRINSSGSSLFFRMSNTSNYWQLASGGTGTAYTVYKIVAGAATLVATLTATASSSDTVAVKLSGNVITPVINGVEQTPITDSFNVTGTMSGVNVGGSTAATHTWDDFSHKSA